MDIEKMKFDELPEMQQCICKALKPLYYTFPSAKITGATFIAYSVVLSDLSPDDISKAVIKIMRTEEFFPTPAKIRKEVEGIRSLQVGREKTPEEAWEEVIEQVRHWSPGRDVKWSSPRIKRAVRIVGFDTIALSENISVQYAHFTKAYKSLLEREKEEVECIESDRIFESVKKISARMTVS